VLSKKQFLYVLYLIKNWSIIGVVFFIGACVTMEENKKSYLYHLVPQDRWLSAKNSNQEYFPEDYEKDHFIHLSPDIKRLLKIANKYYTHDKRKFLVLKIDTDKISLPSEVKFETGVAVNKPSKPENKKSSQQIMWPHLYGGGLKSDFITNEFYIKRDSEGKFLTVIEESTP
jgi:uncharacterized protein (DUF952 family)